jgi:hypothetical protein
MEVEEVSQFQTHLAVHDKVASSTQNQAFNAILFLYRHVLKKELGMLENVTRAKRPPRLPGNWMLPLRPYIRPLRRWSRREELWCR